MEDQKTQPQPPLYYQDGKSQSPPPPRERKDGTLKVLLGTVIALVTLIAAGAVVLLVSQSNVSTHINRSVAQNTSSSNVTTTNKGTPQTIIVQPKAQTTTQTQTVTQPSASSSPSASSGGSSTPVGSGASDAALSTSQYGTGFVNRYGNISATYSVSSLLANNIFYEYWKAGGSDGSTQSVQAWSQTLGQYLNAACIEDNYDTSTIDCAVSGTADPHAHVEFPLGDVQTYTQDEASNYAANHNVGPNG
jgi:hypothetical protein